MNRKRSIESITALLLSFLLLFQTNVISATIGTVSEDETAGVEVPAAVSGNRPSESPANPIHHCNKESATKDTTTWSYVYFGSYPQSEVTDSAVIAVIDKAMSKYGTIADTGVDVWVNGIKYRRISKNDTDYNGYFDDVSNNGYRYFKWERIKWRILQNDGSTLFVVADKAIDCKEYHEEWTGSTWENSTIRDWLNTSFYNTAFSSSEQGAIVTQNVVNEDNSYHDVEGGNHTNDNIYLLSNNEVTNEIYGFCSCSVESMSRRMKASDYANARGAWRNSMSGYEGNCWWWLRSPGGGSVFAAYVDYGGVVYRFGDAVNVCSCSGGVCPALYINLSSDIWLMKDDGIIPTVESHYRDKSQD